MLHAHIKARHDCWRLTASSNHADPANVIKPCLHTTPRDTTPRKVNDAFESALSNLRALSALMKPIGAECAHPARVDLYAAATTRTTDPMSRGADLNTHGTACQRHWKLSRRSRTARSRAAPGYPCLEPRTRCSSPRSEPGRLQCSATQPR